MKIAGLIALLAIPALVPNPAWSKPPAKPTSASAVQAKFGAEFTFFNPQTGNRTGTNRFVQRLRDHLVGSQPDGFKFKEELYIDEDVDYDAVPNGQYAGRDVSPKEMTSLSTGRFTSPEGWWFEWGLDDGVVEIKSKPMAVDEFRRYKDNMQDAIFASASSEGLSPPLFLGGGHINIGMDVFRRNDMLLRNFIVDSYNHNELFMGIFNYDTHNAAALDIQAPEVQKEVAAVIRAFDEGEFKGNSSQDNFLEALQSALDSKADKFMKAWNKNEPAGEADTRWTFFALNFSHVEQGKPWSRIEVRAVRAQWSMDMFIRQVDLFQKRLQFLAGIKKPIPFRPLVKVAKLTVKDHLTNPPVDPQEALRSFYQYVSESGAKWSDHRDYMWPEWMWPRNKSEDEGERAKFERSEWFLQREQATNCEALLAPAI